MTVLILLTFLLKFLNPMNFGVWLSFSYILFCTSLKLSKNEIDSIYCGLILYSHQHVDKYFINFSKNEITLFYITLHYTTLQDNFCFENIFVNTYMGGFLLDNKDQKTGWQRSDF